MNVSELSNLERSLRRPQLESAMIGGQPRADLAAAQNKIVDVVTKAFCSETFLTEKAFITSPIFQKFTVKFNWDFATDSILCSIDRELIQDQNDPSLNKTIHKNECVLLDPLKPNHGVIFYGKKSSVVKLLTNPNVVSKLKEVVETALLMINEKRPKS